VSTNYSYPTIEIDSHDETLATLKRGGDVIEMSAGMDCDMLRAAKAVNRMAAELTGVRGVLAAPLVGLQGSDVHLAAVRAILVTDG
jgi:hypothetical protein